MESKNRFRELREEKGMSPARLAATFGKSESAIRLWEKGHSNPDVATLIRLAGFFSCTTDYLLGLGDMRCVDEDWQTKRIAALAKELNVANTVIANLKQCKRRFDESFNDIVTSR